MDGLRVALLGGDPWTSRLYTYMATALAAAVGFTLYAAVTWTPNGFAARPSPLTLFLLGLAGLGPTAAVINAYGDGGLLASTLCGLAPVTGAVAMAAAAAPVADAVTAAAGTRSSGVFVLELVMVGAMSGMAGHLVGLTVRVVEDYVARTIR